MQKKINSLLQYAFFLGLAIFLVWWSLSKISDAHWEEMKTAMRETNYWLLVPVAIALLVSHLSRAIRWKILMEPMGYKPSLINTYLAVLIGYFANQGVPRLGEVLKCTILSRYEKVPADKLIGTIVAERAFDLLCLILVFAITFFSQISVIGKYAGDLLNQLLYGSAEKAGNKGLYIGLGIVFILLLLVWWLLRRYADSGFVKKIKAVVGGIWQGINSIRYLKHKGWFLFHSFLIWFLYLASIRIGFYAMTATQPYGWLPSFSVLSLGSVGMIVTPGGMGAYPILVQETMSLYGLSEGIGNAFGYILWLAQFVLVLVAGAVSLMLLPVLNRKKTPK
ncbi:lysylphosphatidylglycerol synthase transmembrane domain-containing protein [Flavihumibacter cheonanensis]|uniref:lysylphosphatidylglycerol synthase transmembrane domain-containing protein n=1 Tax=Flavihumibacter cheonanensis TaxID=1442385 RepID=UPI001EF8F3F0|nr:lysylphosphatidylglycerol synthase transmembrane domain-containing protein [Flavihumibacter cheonanensis]MCG7751226.1 flippase-like domain-containing protein [Flavihumibacter cheonanensis]